MKRYSITAKLWLKLEANSPEEARDHSKTIVDVAMTDYLDTHSASTVQALMNAGAGGLAPLVASLLGGVIYDTLGPASIYVTCALAVLCAIITLAIAAARGVFRAGVPLRSGDEVSA